MNTERRSLPRHPLLRADAVSRVYSQAGSLFGKRTYVYALSAVSFYLRHGETLGVVGESGSGKSTLARILVRLDKPTTGRVFLDGTDITDLSETRLFPHRRRMQLMFQDPYASLDPRMTVEQVVSEGIRIHQLVRAPDMRARVAALLTDVGLDPSVMDRFPHEFSGGERQRIALARSLSVDPKLIVCDEPVSSLDVSVQAQILNLLERVQEERGIGIVFISHDLRVISHISHRVMVMIRGRVVEIGPTREVLVRRFHPYTQELFDARPGESKPASSRRLSVIETARDARQPGCVYFDDCGKRQPGKCDKETPPLDTPDPAISHRVACFFVDRPTPRADRGAPRLEVTDE